MPFSGVFAIFDRNFAKIMELLHSIENEQSVVLLKGQSLSQMENSVKIDA